MMKPVKYALRGISIEQFAMLFEPQSDDVELEISVPIKTNYDTHTFAVGASIRFVEKGNPFLVVEVYCHFIIENQTWEVLSDSSKRNVVLPRELIDALARVAVSTARGVMCARTENTPYSKFFLPIVEIGNTQGDDLVIPRELRSE